MIIITLKHLKLLTLQNRKVLSVTKTKLSYPNHYKNRPSPGIMFNYAIQVKQEQNKPFNNITGGRIYMMMYTKSVMYVLPVKSAKNPY